MRSVEIKFDYHPFLNKEANDYLANDAGLVPFRTYPPDLNHVPDVVRSREHFPDEMRGILVDRLHVQYDAIGVSKDHLARQQINALKNKDTYTVTTGQQIHIALGPLFFIYKILSCIDIADKLNKENPGYHFVPLFWMASEDHDFEEINYVKLYGKTYSWDHYQEGPVGKYDTKSLLPVLHEIRERLDQTEDNMKMMDLFEEVYSKHNNLATATQDLIHRLLGHRGLVVLEPDDTELKRQFTPIIKNDVLNNINYTPLDQYSQDLKESGYDLQINPQEINHFLLKDGKRLKIRKNGDDYILDTGETFSTASLEQRIEEHPEDFSPNVVMRPLYQETILPNIMYIPGGSELRYWLQLKGVFAANHVSFPMVIPRTSAVVISDKTLEQIENLGGTIEEMFLTEHDMSAQRRANTDDPVSKIQEKLKEIKSYLNGLPPDLQRITPQEAPPLKNIGQAGKNVESILDWINELPPEIKNQDPFFKKLLKIKRRFFDLAFPQERGEFCINNLPFIIDLTIQNEADGMFTECRNLNVWVTKSI